jgi:hypothetical protein
MKFFRRVTASVAFLYLAAALAQSPTEIAPGISLPATGAMVAVDRDATGSKTVALHATEIKSDGHAGSNFARGLVYSGPHATIELDGLSAAVVVHTATPVFYVRLASDDPDMQRNRLTLIRLKPAKTTRIAADFSANVFGGSRKRQDDEIAVEKTDVENGAWLKVTPTAPLKPGEYGLAYIPKDKLLFADTIYDFSISPPK